MRWQVRQIPTGSQQCFISLEDALIQCTFRFILPFTNTRYLQRAACVSISTTLKRPRVLLAGILGTIMQWHQRVSASCVGIDNALEMKPFQMKLKCA